MKTTLVTTEHNMPTIATGPHLIIIVTLKKGIFMFIP